MDCTKGGVCTTKVPNVLQGAKVENNMHATNQNDDFWETPIRLMMMNDMMEKHETSNKQKAFEKKNGHMKKRC